MVSPFYIVLVHAPPTLRSQLKELVNGELLEVREITDLRQVADQSRIDLLVLGKGLKFEELTLAQTKINLSSTVVLAGPLPVQDIVSVIRGLVGEGRKGIPIKSIDKVTLEDYVESKFGEFIRAMKASSARSLYSTIIHAVERPMIELALRETQGNQIQAAQLLGLNRNTLRKKITECKISVKKRLRSQHNRASS